MDIRNFDKLMQCDGCKEWIDSDEKMNVHGNDVYCMKCIENVLIPELREEIDYMEKEIKLLEKAVKKRTRYDVIEEK